MLVTVFTKALYLIAIFFSSIKEACVLLTLKRGSATLVKEIIYQALHETCSDPYEQVTDPVATLHDVNVFKLSLEEAELVLSRRTDLTK